MYTQKNCGDFVCGRVKSSPPHNYTSAPIFPAEIFFDHNCWFFFRASIYFYYNIGLCENKTCPTLFHWDLYARDRFLRARGSVQQIWHHWIFNLNKTEQFGVCVCVFFFMLHRTHQIIIRWKKIIMNYECAENYCRLCHCYTKRREHNQTKQVKKNTHTHNSLK